MKRCKSRDQVFNQRCEKPRHHGRGNPRDLHQDGALVWPQGRNDLPTSRLSDLPIPPPTPTSTRSGRPPIFFPTPAWFPPIPAAEAVVPLDPEQELRSWWFDQAGIEIDSTVPKAIEYGSTDLQDIGRDLARTAGRQVTDEEAAELGVYFYLRGKLSRWTSAIERGERPSDDTLFDLGVYVRMAQRIRHAGGWPGKANGHQESE